MSPSVNRPAVATGTVRLAGYELNIGAPEYLPSPSGGDPFLHILPNGELIAHSGALDAGGCYRSSDGGRTWGRGHWGLGVSIVNRRDGSVVAMDMQAFLVRFFRGLEDVMADLGLGGINPVVDKGLGVASGLLAGHQRTRPPYIGWSDEGVQKVRAWLTERYPELLAPGNL